MPHHDPHERHRIIRLETVDSTNAEAMRRALAGEPGPLWIEAREQTAGRGRSGRLWTSGAGNLFASLMLRLAAQGPKVYQLSLVAGVAVIEAVRALMPGLSPAPRLKWPNDLMIGRAKAGGILVESSSTGESLAVVIGIGINLVGHPEDLGRPATHLGAYGTAPSAEVLLSSIADSMVAWLARWQADCGFSSVREAWLAAAHPLGERMSINVGSATVEGAFAGLDPEGALLLADDKGAARRFTFGDVTLAGA